MESDTSIRDAAPPGTSASMSEDIDAVDGDESTLSSNHKPKTPIQKKIWLLTYCPAGTYVTVEMLKKHGIVADECHSTADRIMNYTYIHVPKRCRITTIEKFFTAARSEYGIVKNDVFGYDCIGSKSRAPGLSKIEDHIAFKMLVAHSKEKNPSFSPCTDGQPVLSRGPLFHAHEMIEGGSVPLESQTRTQLINYARRLEERLKKFEENERQLREMTGMYVDAARERCNLRLENDSLLFENNSLKRRIELISNPSTGNERTTP